MLEIRRITKSLKDILTGPKLSAEQQLEMETVMPVLIPCLEHPDIALVATSGVFLPPHERTMLRVAHRGAQSNVFVCSRGTSKSSVIDVLYPAFVGLFFSKRKSVLLSAAGFRGSQLLFADMEKWAHGGWDSQQGGHSYHLSSTPNVKFIQRLANYWTWKPNSMSEFSCFPTNDEAKLRGIRGHDLYLDEVNTMTKTLVDIVSEPFLNVGTDFRSGGLNSLSNRVFYTTTIDYSWRDFNETHLAARRAIERDLLALKSAHRGDWDSYRELSKDPLGQYSYCSFDYTDTIIRQAITNRDGTVYDVSYPRHEFNKELAFVEMPGGIPYTTRNELGELLQDGPAVTGLQTYPVQVQKLEQKLRDGTGSVSAWLSEQRNVIDSAVGDVYPHHVIDRAACSGDRYLLPYEKCPPEWQERYKVDQRGYAPEVMWRCTDPCVIGVDYAGGNRDFSALVVIRLGPLATGDFDLTTGLGKTTWCNVIWCEMHRLTSHKDVADKIREYAERYNLVYHYDQTEDDPWKLCRAVGLDMKGGGTGVRDELVHINKQTLDAGEYRMYDPLDKDERVLAFAKDKATSKPMLDTIHASDQLNDTLVEYTLGQMTQGLFFVPKVYNDGNVGVERKLRIGISAVETLTHQLRKLQRAPTKNYHTYFMNGDKAAVENKKDLWSAFIYAAKQARAHVIRQRMIDDRPPPVGAVVTKVGAKRGLLGQTPGTKQHG